MNSDDPLDEQAKMIAEGLWMAGYSDFSVAVAHGAASSTAQSPDRSALYERLAPDSGDLFNWFCVMED